MPPEPPHGMVPAGTRAPREALPLSSPHPTPPADRGDREERRARILRAALHVCARRGVAGARMEEVAARARVSKATLYREFESKEDLFLATLLASYEEGLGIVGEEVDPDAPPAEQLDQLLEGLVRVLSLVAPRMNVHYQAWGVVAKEPRYQQRLYRFLRDFHRARVVDTEAILRAGRDGGAFRRDLDCAAFADGINALLSGYLYRASFDAGRARPADLRRCFRAMVRAAVD